ncbi:8290_t:CDS:2 [Rhizophagus irregularis]|nr:8290_t:CDS:2 [Rhizophagus irregularis]
MGNISSSNPKYTSASNSSSFSSSKSPNNSTNKGLSKSTNDDSSSTNDGSSDDGSSDSSNESSSDSSNSSSSDIIRYNVIKDKLKDEELDKSLELYKRQLKQKYKRRFKRQYKRRYKSDSTNNDSSDSSNGSDISQYNVIKDKLNDEELCESLELYEQRFKSDIEKIYNSLGKEELNKLILSLGDETRFLNRYLKLDDNHLDKINRDLQKLDRLQGNNFIPSEEDGRDLLSDNRSDNSFLRYLANSLFRNKYGMFHVGLEIDGIVLEWGTGDAGPHLIYPRINTNRLYEKIAHIRINYDSNFDREFIFTSNIFLQNWKYHLHNFLIGIMPSNKLQIIAQKCVNWNKNFYYNPVNRNCQRFIEEILETLGLKFNPEGEFKRFLDRIVEYADDRFLFEDREFLSRQELDQFTDQNWDKITNVWDKKLLLCYSNMMNNMYKYKYDEKWGPINNKEKWLVREYELRTD